MQYLIDTNMPVIESQAEVHPQYDYAKYEIKKVRDCVDGGPTVKRNGYTYLPHPSQVDTESDDQQARYIEYKNGAEFDDQPADTLHTLLGKARPQKSEFILPSTVDYLEQDADGDGMSLAASIEYAMSNVIQCKWHVAVADYSGLSDVEINEVSLADVADMNLRANIKQYKRENVINWHYKRVNGKMQLAFIMLLETGSEFNNSNFTHTHVNSYLILALDEIGEYYQQKIVYAESGYQEGKRSYVSVGGQPLNFLPVEIIADQELEVGKLPKGVGFLHKICEASLSKYRVSAVYKEVQRNLAPTMITKGWGSGDLELFKEINGGRDYVTTGAGQVNNLPNEVDYDVLSVSMSMDDFHWYFTYADKKILSMGGTAKQESVNMTATEADINANEQNAKLETIADNLESCFERLIAYCDMFEGGRPVENIYNYDDEIVVSMPREFSTPKLSVNEVKTIIELVNTGIKTQEQASVMLAQGGWDYQDAETTIAELEVNAPRVGVTQS